MKNLIKQFNINKILKSGQTQNAYIGYYNELLMYADKRWPGLKKNNYPNDCLNVHHRIPRCVGGKDYDDNLVLLSYEAHILAHLLLYRAFPNIVGFAKSAKLMLRPLEGVFENLENINILHKIREIAKIKKEVNKALCMKTVCTTVNGEIVRIYESQNAATEEGFDSGGVSSSVRLNQISYGYVFWNYEDFKKEHPKEVREFERKVKRGEPLPELRINDEEWRREQTVIHNYLVSTGSRKVRKLVGYNDKEYHIFNCIRDVQDFGFLKASVRRASNRKPPKTTWYKGYYWEDFSEELIKKLNKSGVKEVDKISPIPDPINHIVCLTKDMTEIVRMYPSFYCKELTEDGFYTASVEHSVRGRGKHYNRGYMWYFESDLNRPDLVEKFRQLDKLPELQYENFSDGLEVVQCDTEMNVIKIYPSVYNCEITTQGEGKENFTMSPIYRSLTKPTKKYRGYYWRLLSKYKLEYPEKYKEYEERNKLDDNAGET